MGLVASPANAERGDPPVPVLTWKACGPSNPGKLCATATVPLDYDKPAGRTTEVALAKLPASEPARRIGTVFINPGGPAAPEWAISCRVWRLPGGKLGRPFRRGLGFDPRGVAGSDPLHCFDSGQQFEAFFNAKPIFRTSGVRSDRSSGITANWPRSASMIGKRSRAT